MEYIMIWPFNIISTWWKLRKIRQEDPYIYEEDEDEYVEEEN